MRRGVVSMCRMDDPSQEIELLLSGTHHGHDQMVTDPEERKWNSILRGVLKRQ